MQILQESTSVRVFFDKVAGNRYATLLKRYSNTGCLSPVVASVGFRFPACNFINKETPERMFCCEFCQPFKNIFSFDHLWVTTSYVYLWILRHFSEHLFYRAPQGNCYFMYKLQSFNHQIQSKTISLVLFKHFLPDWEVAIWRHSFT